MPTPVTEANAQCVIKVFGYVDLLSLTIEKDLEGECVECNI